MVKFEKKRLHNVGNALIVGASFIRLKEINLEYNLSKKLAGKLHLRGAKLFVQARNLGLIYCQK